MAAAARHFGLGDFAVNSRAGLFSTVTGDLLSFGGTKLRRSPTPAQLRSLPAGREHVANTCEDRAILSQTAILR